MFAVAKKETGNGLDACVTCHLLPTKIAPSDSSEIEELVDDIEDLIFWENGGQATDWTLYPFEYLKLFSAWRDAERDVENLRQARFQAFLRGWMEKK